jgi:hypothetical protein
MGKIKKKIKILIGITYGKKRVGRPKSGRKRQFILEIDITEVTSWVLMEKLCCSMYCFV